MSNPGSREPQARFLRACRRLPVDRTPVWFMRQAGRYMAEYRSIRERYSLLEICDQPELAAEVTLQPIQAMEVDAAILFADILLPLIPMGAELEYIPGRGPVIHNPVRSKADLNSLKSFDVNQALNHVMKTIKILRQELPEKTPLIGFAGAPFTVACYLIEGGSSRNYQHAKSLMYSEPKIWFALMERLTDVLADYLLGQVQSGAQALQIFDSWVGSLSPDDYRAFAQPFSARLLEKVTATDVPVIHFGTGTATLLPSMREAGGDVIGVDWRIPLDKAWEKIGHDRAIQGNLDPTLLFAPESVLERAVGRILEQAGGRPGHIFNLGHGILPGTPVENVRAVVDLVHTMSEVGEGGREG